MADISPVYSLLLYREAERVRRVVAEELTDEFFVECQLVMFSGHRIGREYFLTTVVDGSTTPNRYVTCTSPAGVELDWRELARKLRIAIRSEPSEVEQSGPVLLNLHRKSIERELGIPVRIDAIEVDRETGEVVERVAALNPGPRKIADWVPKRFFVEDLRTGEQGKDVAEKLRSLTNSGREAPRKEKS